LLASTIVPICVPAAMTDPSPNDATVTEISARPPPGWVLAFREPLFRRLFLTLVVSDVGVWAQAIVVGAYLFSLTGSAVVVGAATFGGLGPMLAVPLIGGWLADRWERRVIASWALVVQAGFSLLLAVSAALAWPAAMLVCVFVVGIANATGYPALAALLPTVVPRRVMHSAVALQNVEINFARVIGPVVGGLLFVASSASAVFVFNALTYVFVLAVLLSPVARLADRSARAPTQVTDSEPKPQPRSEPVQSPGSAPARLVRYTVVRIGLFSLLGLGFGGLMPVLATEIAGIDVASWSYAVFYGFFAVGCALGAFSSAVVRPRSADPSVRISFWIVAVGLGCLAAMPTRGPVPAVVAITVVGAAYLYAVTHVLSGLHLHIPDAIRGRVMAQWIVAYVGMGSLGALLAGPVAQAVGIRVLIAMNAVTALAAGWSFPPRWIDRGERRAVQ
jgi:MFS family permease